MQKFKCKIPDGTFDFIKPYEKLTPLEWVQKYIYLPQSESAKPGLLKLAPWFYELINLLEDPDIDEIQIASAAQVGKTLYELACLIYFLCKYDQPAMLVSADERLAESTIRRRLAPIIEASPELKSLIKTDREHRNTTEVWGLNASIRAAWAGSPTSLASFPAKLCVLDETAKYGDQVKTESSAVELAEARLTQYRGAGAKLISVSTPVLDDDEFGKRFNRNNQYHWSFTCPHCKAQTFPAFENLVWDKLVSIAELEKGKTIAYKCEHCEKTIEEKEYRRLVRLGKWELKQASDKTTKRRSYWLTGMLSQQRSFAYLVTKFLRVKESPADLQGFYNSELGRFWVQQRIEIKEPQLQALITDTPKNIVPPGTMQIVAGIDVGGDKALPIDPLPESEGKSLHFWLSIMACLPGGRFQLIHTSYNENWSQCEAKLNETYYCPEENKYYHVANAFIDSGHTPQQITSLAVKTGITVSKGFEFISNEFVKLQIKDTIPNGFGKKTNLASPIKYAAINTNRIKEQLTNLIEIGFIKFNQDLHSDLFKHITSEVKRTKKTKTGLILVYAPKYQGIPNHLLDTIIYALACSYIMQHFKYATLEEWNLVNGIVEKQEMTAQDTEIEDSTHTTNSNIPNYGENISPW